MKALILALALIFCSFSAHASWVASAADDRVVFSSNAALAFASGGDWTVSAWVRLPSNAGTALRSFVATATGTGNNPAYLINCYEASHASNPGKILVTYNDDGTLDESAISSSTPCNTTDTWFHVLTKRESNVLTIRVNGTQVGSSGSVAMVGHAAAAWYFFTRPDLTSDRSGQLCDFAKWNRALTNREITGLAQRASASSYLRGLEVWAPAIGDFQERVAGLTVTATGATIGKCPPLFYPQ